MPRRYGAGALLLPIAVVSKGVRILNVRGTWRALARGRCQRGSQSLSHRRLWLSCAASPLQDVYTVNPVAGAAGDRPSPYRGGLFRVSIKLSDNYPADAPEVRFAAVGGRGPSLWIVWRTPTEGGTSWANGVCSSDCSSEIELRSLVKSG